VNRLSLLAAERADQTYKVVCFAYCRQGWHRSPENRAHRDPDVWSATQKKWVFDDTER
jgi:hypothetical protein